MSQVRLYLTARKPEAFHIASILDPVFEELGYTNVLFEDDENPGNWCYSVYVEADEADAASKILRDNLGSDAFALPLEIEKLGDEDWVSKSLKDLSPVEAGRFFVHGSHDREIARTRPVPIEIDASTLPRELVEVVLL